MSKSIRSRRSITRTASRAGAVVERLEQRFAMAANCGCGAAVEPSVTQTETEPAAFVATPEVSATRSGAVRPGATVDTSRLSGLVGSVAAARSGSVTSRLTRAMSLNEPRQVAGAWREGAYLGGTVFRDPFPGDCPVRPCLASNGISFRLGPDLQGRPNVMSNLRISFLATLIKTDGTGTREGRVIDFNYTAPEPLRDDLEITPVLELVPGRRAQTFEFQVRGGFNNEHIFVVELKLNWNNQTKRFTASMKATSDVIDGEYYMARTYPAGRAGVVLASGPSRVVRDAAGLIVGVSGAVRRTGA